MNMGTLDNLAGANYVTTAMNGLVLEEQMKISSANGFTKDGLHPSNDVSITVKFAPISFTQL